MLGYRNYNVKNIYLEFRVGARQAAAMSSHANQKIL